MVSCSRQCASYLFWELVTRVYECSDHTCPAPSTALLSGGEPQSLPQAQVLRTEANAYLRHRDVCLLGVRGQGQHRVRGWAHPLYSRKSDPTCSSSDQPSSLKLSVVTFVIVVCHSLFCLSSLKNHEIIIFLRSIKSKLYCCFLALSQPREQWWSSQ